MERYFKDKYGQVWKLVIVVGQVYVWRESTGLGLFGGGEGLIEINN